MARLRAATRAEHESVERQMYPLLRVHDAGTYRCVLEQFLGFFLPLESALGNVPGLRNAIPDLDCRMRAELLKCDLASLGFTGPAPSCPAMPEIRTVPQAIGCLYVAEGSTLGGQLIVRELRGLSHACRFFSSYGADVGTMWKTFCAAVETYASGYPGEEETMCASARETFRSLEAWIVEKPCLTTSW